MGGLDLSNVVELPVNRFSNAKKEFNCSSAKPKTQRAHGAGANFKKDI
jgi:hypothetical protein